MANSIRPVVAASLVACWALARTRYAWVAGSVALMLALPRFLIYEIGFALVGLADGRARASQP